MFMKRGIIAVVALLGMIGTVNAALITSPLDPSLAGSTLINFDTISTQNAVSFTIGDVTFSTNAGTMRVAPFNEGGDFGGSGQALSTRSTANPSTMNIDFSNPVSAFGMVWGAANPNWNVNLFDSSSNLIESLVFDGGTGGTGGSFFEFYGATNTGITRVEMETFVGFDWVLIDDFQYVVDGGQTEAPIPEPATVALLGIGLAGLVGVGVRRKMKGKAVEKS